MNLLKITKTVMAKAGQFFKRTPVKPKAQTFIVESKPVAADPDRVRPTKAYADGRQKSPRNRKRKPKKALKNLYKL